VRLRDVLRPSGALRGESMRPAWVKLRTAPGPPCFTGPDAKVFTSSHPITAGSLERQHPALIFATKTGAPTRRSCCRSKPFMRQMIFVQRKIMYRRGRSGRSAPRPIPAPCFRLLRIYLTAAGPRDRSREHLGAHHGRRNRRQS